MEKNNKDNDKKEHREDLPELSMEEIDAEVKAYRKEKYEGCLRRKHLEDLRLAFNVVVDQSVELLEDKLELIVLYGEKVNQFFNLDDPTKLFFVLSEDCRQWEVREKLQRDIIQITTDIDEILRLSVIVLTPSLLPSTGVDPTILDQQDKDIIYWNGKGEWFARPAGHDGTPITWLKYVQRDFKSTILTRDKAQFPGSKDNDAATFWAQQTVEKAIKGILLHHNVLFPYIHNLDCLIRLCRDNNIAIPESLADAGVLTKYALYTRGPLGFYTPDEFVDTAVTLASEALKWAESVISPSPGKECNMIDDYTKSIEYFDDVRDLKNQTFEEAQAEKEAGMKDLLKSIKQILPELEALLNELNPQDDRLLRTWGSEDNLYKFWQRSPNVDRMRDDLRKIVAALLALHRGRHEDGGIFDPLFSSMLSDALVNEKFTPNSDAWLRWSRSVAEAYMHAMFFLQVAVKYGHALDAVPATLPSGWGALLCLYGLR